MGTTSGTSVPACIGVCELANAVTYVRPHLAEQEQRNGRCLLEIILIICIIKYTDDGGGGQLLTTAGVDLQNACTCNPIS